MMAQFLLKIVPLTFLMMKEFWLQDTLIIKNGILQTGIADTLSALKLNITPTGNGKRESYKRKAYTRMTTIYFERGKSNLDDMNCIQ